ncbi:hypothetical protein [Chryseobacterium shigense]|uniref:Uncharacterized protein n=1 Tax=Chryseobacterium shigense TaxID=297244 RepID=A0A841N9W7_9FLAO|nr:hypothetical protein [Chryseobacterium shigense]MBB6370398.1 hypothetical protein [Chryseobacterium shigense]
MDGLILSPYFVSLNVTVQIIIYLHNLSKRSFGSENSSTLSFWYVKFQTYPG